MTHALQLKSCALLLFVALATVAIVGASQDMLIQTTVQLLNGLNPL